MKYKVFPNRKECAFYNVHVNDVDFCCAKCVYLKNSCYCTLSHMHPMNIVHTSCRYWRYYKPIVVKT